MFFVPLQFLAAQQADEVCFTVKKVPAKAHCLKYCMLRQEDKKTDTIGYWTIYRVDSGYRNIITTRVKTNTYTIKYETHGDTTFARYFCDSTPQTLRAPFYAKGKELKGTLHLLQANPDTALRHKYTRYVGEARIKRFDGKFEKCIVLEGRDFYREGTELVISTRYGLSYSPTDRSSYFTNYYLRKTDLAPLLITQSIPLTEKQYRNRHTPQADKTAFRVVLYSAK